MTETNKTTLKVASVIGVTVLGTALTAVALKKIGGCFSDSDVDVIDRVSNLMDGISGSLGAIACAMRLISL